MISLSTKEIVRFTPPWKTGDDAPIYLIRVGSVIDRAQIEAELAGEHDAGRTYSWEVHEAFKSGLIKLGGGGGDVDHVLSLAINDMAGEDLAPDEAKMLAEVRDELAQFYDPYRAIKARQARRKEMAPILAFSRFVVGWEGLSVDYSSGFDGRVSDSALKHIDALDLIAVGGHAFSLLYPSEDASGNSKPDSAPVGDQANSQSGRKKAGAGRSATASGKRTRSKP